MSRSDESHEQVEIYVNRLVRQTDKAALCLIDGEEVWLPWSQIDEGSEIERDGDSGSAYIPRWLAEKHNLNYDE
jgi:hypothetical protein